MIVIDGNIHLCGCEFFAQYRDVAPLFVVEGIIDTYARVTREHWSVTVTPGGSDDSFDEYGMHLYQIPARCGCGCPKPRQQVFVAVLSPRRRNCRLGPTFSDRPAASPRARSVAARPRAARRARLAAAPPRDRVMVDFLLGHQVMKPERAPRCGLKVLPDRLLAGAGLASVFWGNMSQNC